MTTLAYDHTNQTLGADTRLTFENYYGFSTKIIFPKKGVVLTTAGDAGEGEWLRHKLAQTNFAVHDLYFVEDKPKFSKTFSAFVWYDHKPYCIYSDLFPVPLEMDWVDGSGGNFALAYLRIGMPVHEAVLNAAKIDQSSGAPVHVVKLNVKSDKFRVETYNG